MSDLIPVTSGEGGIQTVNARDLHRFLGVGKDFSNWIRDRVAAYNFLEGQDFTVFADFGENPQGGRPSKEYALTLDMAKELAMVERNDRGKQARQYFIECERRAKDPMRLLSDPSALRGLLADYSEKVMALESKVKEAEAVVEESKTIIRDQASKVLALDRIATAEGSMCITDAAKVLQIQPRKLFEFLRSKTWIFQRVGGSVWLGYQDKVQAGFLEHKVTTVSRSDGSEKTVTQVRITPKGLASLSVDLTAEHLQRSTLDIRTT